MPFPYRYGRKVWPPLTFVKGIILLFSFIMASQLSSVSLSCRQVGGNNRKTVSQSLICGSTQEWRSVRDDIPKLSI